MRSDDFKRSDGEYQGADRVTIPRVDAGSGGISDNSCNNFDEGSNIPRTPTPCAGVEDDPSSEAAENADGHRDIDSGLFTNCPAGEDEPAFLEPLEGQPEPGGVISPI